MVSVENQENINAVTEQPKTSTRRVARNPGIIQTFVWWELSNEGLHPYHQCSMIIVLLLDFATSGPK